jgi:hypothetical protein
MSQQPATKNREPRAKKESAMVDQEKLNAVEGYLQSEFPGSKVEVKHEPREQIHVFHIVHEGKSHRAKIVEAFLSFCDISQIPVMLREFTLAEHLRELGATAVVVTPDGLKLEGD